jgi:hypothetical protein
VSPFSCPRRLTTVAARLGRHQPQLRLPKSSGVRREGPRVGGWSHLGAHRNPSGHDQAIWRGLPVGALGETLTSRVRRWSRTWDRIAREKRFVASRQDETFNLGLGRLCPALIALPPQLGEGCDEGFPPFSRWIPARDHPPGMTTSISVRSRMNAMDRPQIKGPARSSDTVRACMTCAGEVGSAG